MRVAADEEDDPSAEIHRVGGEVDVTLVAAHTQEGALSHILAVLLVAARHTLGVGHGRLASLARFDKEAARRVVVLLVPVLWPLGFGRLAEEGKSRVAKIVVADGVCTRADLVCQADLGNELLLGRLVGVVHEGERQRSSVIRMQLVAQRELRTGVVVGEDEGDAGFLEEAAEKGVVALAVLDLEFEFWVAPAVDLPRALDVPLVEELVGDVRD